MAKKKTDDKTKNAANPASTKSLNLYFNSETQKAIVAFQNCEDKKERDRLYVFEIAPAFYKLVENIIHTFRFYYTDVDDLEDLKHEVISRI